MIPLDRLDALITGLHYSDARGVQEILSDQQKMYEMSDASSIVHLRRTLYVSNS